MTGIDTTLQTRDGLSLSATHYAPASPGRDSVVIGSALGVPRYYYAAFARYLAENGYSVWTFDYRGINESRQVPLAGSEMSMREWGSRDISAALSRALEHRNGGKLIYLGHSCGGQLVGLAPESTRIDAMVFVASQLGYWRLWPRPHRYLILMLWQIIPMCTPFFDYLPSWLLRLSNMDLPSGVVRQWARWGMSPGYLFDHIAEGERNRYRNLDAPLLAYGFDDDLLYAPPDSVDALLDYYEAAEIRREQVNPSQRGMERIGHFGFFREGRGNAMWQEVAEWLQYQLDQDR